LILTATQSVVLGGSIAALSDGGRNGAQGETDLTLALHGESQRTLSN